MDLQNNLFLLGMFKFSRCSVERFLKLFDKCGYSETEFNHKKTKNYNKSGIKQNGTVKR